MVTNDLKKGDKVLLRNGWNAQIEDNMKGNTRLCTVYGYCTEMGSVYSHDIMYLYDGGNALTMEVAKETCPKVAIEHTPAQLKVKAMSSALFGG